MSQLARLIEETIVLTGVSASASTAAIDLNKADKFSVVVTATVGASIVSLEASNSVLPPDANTTWTEIDAVTLAEGASDIFEQPDTDYRWARVTITNNDIVDVSGSFMVLVIGDPI